jgi:uncharacterized membrane protein YjjP (DUF1212 family)
VSKTKNEVKDLGPTLLQIGALLLSSGANTGRVRTTVNRISSSFGYKTELLITHRTLMLTLSDEENDFTFNNIKTTASYGVNFKVVSGISRMSWQVVEEKWTVEQIKEEVKRLGSVSHYPRLVVLTLVGLAGASFCRLAGGGPIEMAFVFIASFIGLFVRQESTKMKFNQYMCIYFAALVASAIAGLPSKFGYGDANEHAFATSVLFLIPGVPLINSFSDLIDGNILNGLVRGTNGLIISFSIALGLLTTIYIFQF